MCLKAKKNPTWRLAFRPHENYWQIQNDTCILDNQWEAVVGPVWIHRTRGTLCLLRKGHDKTCKESFHLSADILEEPFIVLERQKDVFWDWRERWGEKSQKCPESHRARGPMAENFCKKTQNTWITMFPSIFSFLQIVFMSLLSLIPPLLPFSYWCQNRKAKI